MQMLCAVPSPETRNHMESLGELRSTIDNLVRIYRRKCAALIKSASAEEMEAIIRLSLARGGRLRWGSEGWEMHSSVVTAAIPAATVTKLANAGVITEADVA